MEGGQETDFKVLHPVTLAFVDGDGEVRKRDGRARRKMSVSSIEWIRDGGRRQVGGWRVCMYQDSDQLEKAKNKTRRTRPRTE